MKFNQPIINMQSFIHLFIQELVGAMRDTEKRGPSWPSGAHGTTGLGAGGTVKHVYHTGHLGKARQVAPRGGKRGQFPSWRLQKSLKKSL